MDDSLELDPFYINQRRVLLLAGNLPRREMRFVHEYDSPHWKILSDVVNATRLLRAWLDAQAEPVRSFEALVAQGKLVTGKIFTTFRNFYCKNVAGARSAPQCHATYKGIAPAGHDVVLRLRLHHDHVVPGSPGGYLRGNCGDLFVVGVIDRASTSDIEANPIFIGRWLTGATGLRGWVHFNSCEVHADDIDSFGLIRRISVPKSSELRAMASISEAAVKKAFASILHEPVVPKDWGGERSDLFTTHLRIDGHRVSAAFVFKGPARFRAMSLADLGKNGDQIERLSNEPAELLVVQHCHSIRPAVRTVIRALCNQAGSAKRYCLIDGYDTLRILRAYQQCGQGRSTRSA